MIAWRVCVRGLVQGVGFRPFVYRMARRLGLRGWVRNDSGGALLHVEGDSARLHDLVSSLRQEAPPGAAISEIECEEVVPANHPSFEIGASSGEGTCLARVPADRVVCEACLCDVSSIGDRRLGYALTTCTDCGPRYSIIQAMPYDRPRTTMAGFEMCPACAAEYRDPLDRRFHAQPIACPECGPRVWLCDASGRVLSEGREAIESAGAHLRSGNIIALKGLGGFQLLVRADLNGPVLRLRQRKRRPTKPLAVVVSSLDAAARLAELSPAERELLAGAVGPIVLVRKRDDAPLAELVAPHLRHVGLMLPTTPLHQLLLGTVDFPVVATSGNVSDEPIAVDVEEARGRLKDIAGVFLVHDRPIARRVDDSVARVIAGRPVLLRLARGFAPMPLPALERWVRDNMPGDVPATLAVGGQQKVALALFAHAQAVLGPHIGDLDDLHTQRAFADSAHDLTALYGCTPGVLACDMHPDYSSTRWAERTGLPIVRVQHHHAHAVACMVEHDLLGHEVLAFTWDGTGLGVDGTIWGGEALLARLDGFTRVARLRPFALPGGEAAVREPGRVALALLIDALGKEAVLADEDLPEVLGLGERLRPLVRMIERGVNCPVTSSMGRLFDAVTALAGCGGLLSLLECGESSPLYHSVCSGVRQCFAALSFCDGEPHDDRTHKERAAKNRSTPEKIERKSGEESPHSRKDRSIPTPSYEGEFASWLESAACDDGCGSYTLGNILDSSPDEGDWRPLIREAYADRKAGVSPTSIAARFHEAVIRWAVAVAESFPNRPIVLGGGCFQNQRLAEGMISRLRDAGREVYPAGAIPPGDGGLAVGQLAVALASRQRREVAHVPGNTGAAR